MKTITINIFDPELIWRGSIENVKSLVHRSSWNEIINSELTISRTAAGIEEMQVGRIIIVNNQLDKALIISEMNTNLADDYWNFVLLPLKGLLNYRICQPIDSGSFTARYQSEVMMLLASNNLVTQNRDTARKFWNSDQTKLLFTVAGLKTFGDIIDFSVDWNTGLLGETIVEVSKMYDDVIGKFPVGWNVYIKDTFDALQMDTYQATNRSIGQNVNRPVVFSEHFNNISDASYVISLTDWASVGYVSWNDGTNDQVTTVASTKHGTSTSFNRKEILLDSSKTKSSEVTSEGRAELVKRQLIQNFTAEIIDNPNTMSTFGVDWFLGDIVTIQSKSLREKEIISVDAQIIELEEVYDSGEYSLHATFGENKLSLIKKMKQALKQRR